MGRDTPLWACLTKTEPYQEGFKAASEIRQMYENDPVVKEVIDVALGLEGLRRQDSIHAAGVVITKEPLTEYLPIQRKPKRIKILRRHRLSLNTKCSRSRTLAY